MPCGVLSRIACGNANVRIMKRSSGAIYPKGASEESLVDGIEINIFIIIFVKYATLLFKLETIEISY